MANNVDPDEPSHQELHCLQQKKNVLVCIAERKGHVKVNGCIFRGANSIKNRLCPHFEKGAALKGKNFFPTGANSFILRADLFLERVCRKAKSKSQKLSPL